MAQLEIIGAGGGGKSGGAGGRAPVEAPDSIRSKAYARVIDLIAEGEIQGLVNGAQSIYLNDTPLQAADGSFNFSGVAWDARNGSQQQTAMPSFTDVSNNTVINAELKYGIPVVRRYDNPNLDMVYVVFGIPVLTVTDQNTGDINGTTVQCTVEVQYNGGGYVLDNNIIKTGKTTSRYQFSWGVSLPKGTGPWDIRVTRVTPDSTSSSLQNRIWWDTSTEVIYQKLRYPNSALVALSVDAAQFSAIPKRAYDMKLLRVKVPSNYNPTTRAYTGAWDGNFQIAWTDNPAWCFYDLLTNTRYGLGNYISAAQVDKWALYSIAKYCDALVSNGFGGYEPRFTCNLYLQTQAEAFKVVNDMASIFRGMAFWASGSITAVQDAPSDPVALFTPANVVDGIFSYSGSSAKARHTVALVSWNDPADMYRQKIEYVEDRDGIARYGVTTTQVAAVGCTSRGQANRVGRWLLFTERLQSEAVTFKTGLEGATVRPGNVIKIADPVRAGVRFGGRLVAGGVSSVTLDAPVTLTAGQLYTFSALKADGTVQETGVTHSGGTLSALTLAPALSEAPAAGSIWMLSGGAVTAQQFRVIAVTETDRAGFEVAAIAHDPAKYDAIENGVALQPRSMSVLSAVPAAPTNLALSESLYIGGGAVRSRLSASWTAPFGATAFLASLQRAGDNEGPKVRVTTPAVDFPDIVPGSYTVRVWSVNAIDKASSQPASVAIVALGKTAPPANVQGFNAARNGSSVMLAWRPVADLDLDHYEIRQGVTWATGIVVGSSTSPTYTVLAPRGGVFMVKAVDTSGVYSVAEASVNVADVSGINVVVTFDEASTGWTGAYTNTAKYKDATHPLAGVALVGSTTWSSMTGAWASYTDPWLFTPPADAGTYTSSVLDVGYVSTSQVSIQPSIELLSNAKMTWATFSQPWSAYAGPDWNWIGLIGAVSASYEISTSNDNVTWSAWSPFVAGAYTFRYVKIRVDMATVDNNYRPYLTQLVVNVDVPDRVLHFKDVAVPTGGVTIGFAPAFIGMKTAQVTLQSAASGDRFTVTGKSTTSVTVNVYDSAGAPKAGIVDVDVFGYGER